MNLHLYIECVKILEIEKKTVDEILLFLEQNGFLTHPARESLQKTRKDIGEVLQKLYAAGRLLMTYQNDFTAICMFSEYLQSGKCRTLEGDKGAYALYEAERKAPVPSECYMLQSACEQIENQKRHITMCLTDRPNAVVFSEYNSSILNQNRRIEQLIADDT